MILSGLSATTKSTTRPGRGARESEGGSIFAVFLYGVSLRIYTLQRRLTHYKSRGSLHACMKPGRV